MRTLIIGATGLVGDALATHLNGSPDQEVICAGSAQADLRRESEVSALVKGNRPDWTVLSAAMTEPDACELDPERARAVNTKGPQIVAQACSEVGARLLLLSTDYVFDGEKRQPYEPNDPVNPLSVYGHSKADGEEAARKTLSEALIVRTSWVFGRKKPGLPGTILALAEGQNEISVVSDQTSAPTYAPDLAVMLDALMRAGASGTFHASGANGCTRLEWAQEILRLAGKSHVRLRGVTNAELKRPARRPAYSVLSTACLKQFGLQPRRWQETIAEHLSQRS